MSRTLPPRLSSRDVSEMQQICEAIAARLAPARSVKEKTGQVQQALGRDEFSWNRVNEFLRGRARRIESWEKDVARKQLEAINLREQDKATLAHMAWLERTLAGWRQSSDPDFHSEDIAAAERVLARARLLARALDDPDEPRT